MKITRKFLSVMLTALLIVSVVPMSGSEWLEEAFQANAYDETSEVTDGYYTYYV